MASSTLLRRISFSQILRRNSLFPNRSVTTTTVGVRPLAAAPWLLLRDNYDELDEEIFLRFYCCAEDRIHNFFGSIESFSDVIPPNGREIRFVGSSYGWLASYDDENDDLFLSDPITDRHVKLPTLRKGQFQRIILSDAVERGGKAFVIFGAAGNSLACCSPQQSSINEWILFGGKEKYESIVYSSSHRCLLSLTSTFKVEAWDVARELPSLDWSIQFEMPRLRVDGGTKKPMYYLVCWEQQIFVVVRHVGFFQEGLRPVGMGLEPLNATVDFEVYEIDGGVMKMKESLGGVAMFVGLNHPFAVKGVEGLKPNYIYYGFDPLINPHRYAHLDCGVFDYQKRQLCHHWRSYQLGYDFIHPMWFHNINI